MDFNRYRIQYWFRMLLILVTTGFLVYWTPRTALVASPVFLGLVLLYQLFSLLRVVEKPQRDTQRFFDAIRYSDFSQTFNVPGGSKSLKPLKEAFDSVVDAFQKTRAEKEAQYRYLQTVVHHIGIGLVVFNKEGNVNLVNQAARKLFQISHLNHIRGLANFDPALPETLLSLKPGQKHHFQLLDPNTGDHMTLSLLSTQFILQGESCFLVSIQNIQSELEEKELDAWQNLIRVLTHEIMNSITPISSLASTAKQILSQSGKQDEKQWQESLEDVNQAIETIEARSDGLLKFVQSYRQLTRLPKPDFRIVVIRDLIHQIEPLMHPQFEKNQVTLEMNVEPESLEVTADPNLIEQVLINLLKNAMEWAGRKPGGRVVLEAHMGMGGRPMIQIKDNGQGIQKEALEKIFIPFYTTKEDGSGIGLSLSRQIMRLHGGSLSAQSNPGVETIFSLKF